MCRSSFSSQSSPLAQFTAMTRTSYFSLNLLHTASCSILPRYTQNCFSQRTCSRTHFLNLLFFTGTLTFGGYGLCRNYPNRSALFLFVKIHILSFGRCTHRGMGHEPLVKVSWPFIFLPRRWARFAWIAGLVRKVGRVPDSYREDLASGTSDGLGRLCFGIGLWPCAWPFFVCQAVFRFWPWAVFRSGLASAGHWPVAVLGLDKPACWRKTKHPTFEAFTKPKNCFSYLIPKLRDELLTVGGYGSQPPTCSKVFSGSYVSFSNHFSR